MLLPGRSVMVEISCFAMFMAHAVDALEVLQIWWFSTVPTPPNNNPQLPAGLSTARQNSMYALL